MLNQLLWLTSLLFLLLNSFPLLAQVVLDGSLGHSGALTGPDYQIPAELGQQHGGNLFHSFKDFNLHSQDRATFSGPETVKNVISRVTGGNPSTIDGTLRSSIPQADFYFLNPYGILFGPTAKLDVQGGFYASTADTLTLGIDGEFNARQPSQSRLTVAPPTAFGFLTAPPAPITVQHSNLSVPLGKTLSVIGGDLQLTAERFQFSFYRPPTLLPQLAAESGRINLVSLASPGTVNLTPTGINLSAMAQGGHIKLQRSWLDVSGPHGGDIYIRGQQLELVDGVISSENYDADGGIVDIQVNDLSLQGNQHFSAIYANTWGNGQGGSIKVLAQHLQLAGGAQITSATFSTGQGGDLFIQTDTLEASGQLITDFIELGYSGDFPDLLLPIGYPSGIFGSTFSKQPKGGNAGQVEITARQIKLTNGLAIINGSFGTGQGGNLVIKATESLHLSGQDQKYPNLKTGIEGSAFHPQKEAGNAGHIVIEAGTMTVSDEAEISSATMGHGHGGSIQIRVQGTLTFEQGLLFSSTVNPDLTEAGNAGQIDIQAGRLVLTNGSAISTSTTSSGHGGTIRIDVNDEVMVQSSAIASTSGNLVISINSGGLSLDLNQPDQAQVGNAGHVQITARQVTLTENSMISSDTGSNGQGGTILLNVTDNISINNSFIFSNSLVPEAQAGNAGLIRINTPHLHLMNNSAISSSTLGSGNSGKIALQGIDTLIIEGGSIVLSGAAGTAANAGNAGQILVQANRLYLVDEGEISTSTLNATGGDILIQCPNLVYLDKGWITTSVEMADDGEGGQGDGGNIQVENPVFMILNQGKIQAQAEQGRGGNIRLTSQQLLKSSESLISASSRLGIDGKVATRAPNETLGNSLGILSSHLLNNVTQIKNPCHQLWEDPLKRSKFVVIRLMGSPPVPTDLKPSHSSKNFSKYSH